MKKAIFIRKKSVISDLSTGENEHFKSIALAKKKSTSIQLKMDGALGRGSLAVTS